MLLRFAYLVLNPDELEDQHGANKRIDVGIRTPRLKTYSEVASLIVLGICLLIGVSLLVSTTCGTAHTDGKAAVSLLRQYFRDVLFRWLLCFSLAFLCVKSLYAY